MILCLYLLTNGNVHKIQFEQFDLLFTGCDATVYASTAEFCTPGADYPGTIGYPDLQSCDFKIFSTNPSEPLSTLFDSRFEIKAGDSMAVNTSYFPILTMQFYIVL